VSKMKVGRKPSVNHDDDYAGTVTALLMQTTGFPRRWRVLRKWRFSGFIGTALLSLPLPLNWQMACTYMPNASWRRWGSKAQGRGLPTLREGAEGGTERAERSGGLHKRSAEDWGSPCTARGQRP
jgi:hypothetical protein